MLSNDLYKVKCQQLYTTQFEDVDNTSAIRVFPKNIVAFNHVSPCNQLIFNPIKRVKKKERRNLSSTFFFNLKNYM